MCSRGDIRSVACACLRKIKIYQGKHIQKDCLKARDNLQIYLILPVQTQQKTPANLSFLASELVLVIVQSLICVRFFVTPRTAAYQALLSFNVSWSLLKLMSIESALPSNHLIFCRPLLLLPSIFPSLRVFPQRVGSSHQVAKVLEKGIIPNDCSVQVGGSLWADGPKAGPLRAEEGQTSPESVFTLQEGQEPPKPRSTVQ